MELLTPTSEKSDSLSYSNYSFVFNFESNFNASLKTQQLVTYRHYAFYCCIIYVIVVFGGQSYMQSRKKLELRRTLVVWNMLLAAFSITALCRTLPDMIHVLKEFGFTYSACDPAYTYEKKISGVWIWFFTLSKVPELGDTVFIVLRKQRLIFLHWFHHITVLLFSFYAYSDITAQAGWYAVMNLLAHSMMYTYYALKALRVKLPSFVATSITLAQTIQMGMGCFVTCFAYISKRKGNYCEVKDYVSFCAFIMYTSYFALFAQFFYKTYISPPKRARKLD